MDGRGFASLVDHNLNVPRLGRQKLRHLLLAGRCIHRRLQRADPGIDLRPDPVQACMDVLGSSVDRHHRIPESAQCHSDEAALRCVGVTMAGMPSLLDWFWITRCLTQSLRAAFGLAFERCVGTGCEGPAGVTCQERGNRPH